jgi:hypothetical protein
MLLSPCVVALCEFRIHRVSDGVTGASTGPDGVAIRTSPGLSAEQSLRNAWAGEGSSAIRRPASPDLPLSLVGRRDLGVLPAVDGSTRPRSSSPSAMTRPASISPVRTAARPRHRPGPDRTPSVGAGAVVTRDLPPNVVAVGIPACVTREIPAQLRSSIGYWPSSLGRHRCSTTSGRSEQIARIGIMVPGSRAPLAGQTCSLTQQPRAHPPSPG